MSAVNLHVLQSVSTVGTCYLFWVHNIALALDSESREMDSVVSRFVTYHRERWTNEKDLPTILLSYAQSMDGSICARVGTPTSISSSTSLKMTHSIRAASSAIAVGIGTVLADNPSLSVRLVEGSNPLPVIFDPNLRCPLNARFFDRNPVIFCFENASKEKRLSLEKLGARIVPCPSFQNKLDLLGAFRQLRSKFDVESVMVEGGASIITSLLSNSLPHYAIITISPQFVCESLTVSFFLFSP